MGKRARLPGFRFFHSLLKNMFPKECNLSLADLIEGSLMLKYNNAKRAAEKLAARA